MRRFAGELTDAADRAEQDRTCFILDGGAWGLAAALIGEAVRRPRRWLAALATAVTMGRRSERGLFRHLIYLAEACRLRRRLAALRSSRTSTPTSAPTRPSVAMLCRSSAAPLTASRSTGPRNSTRPDPSPAREDPSRRFRRRHQPVHPQPALPMVRPEDWRKIHVVRCGLDEVFLSPTPTPVPDRPRLVNVGRLSEQKGQLLLIEAAAQLQAQGLDFELVIVGDGPLRGELERLIDQHGLRGRVRITGFLDNDGVRRELEAARALVMPSFAEGLPVVIMEAMALGRPVISTYIAGIPELVEPGVTAGWSRPGRSSRWLTRWPRP